MAHGVRQMVWGGLRLAVAAEVAGAVEGQPPASLSAPVAVVEAAAGPALGDGSEDQRITVEPVEVAFERPWSWARGLDAFHMMRHRNHVARCETLHSPRSAAVFAFPEGPYRRSERQMSVISGRRGTPSRPCRQECFLRSVPLSFHTTRVTRPVYVCQVVQRDADHRPLHHSSIVPGHCTDQLGLQDARQSTADPGAVLEHDPQELLQPTSGLRGHQLRLDGPWLRLAAARMPSSATLSSSSGARSPSPVQTPRRPRSARRARHRSPGAPIPPSSRTDGSHPRRRTLILSPLATERARCMACDHFSPLASQSLGMSRPHRPRDVRASTSILERNTSKHHGSLPVPV